MPLATVDAIMNKKSCGENMKKTRLGFMKLLPSLPEGSGMGRFKDDIGYACIDPPLYPLSAYAKATADTSTRPAEASRARGPEGGEIFIAASSFLFTFFLSQPLHAEPPFAAPDWMSELRAGLLTRDIDLSTPLAAREEEGGAATAELLFTSPAFLKPFWSPRPIIGGTVNFSGGTNHV